MRQAACGHDNPNGARFCRRCGRRLVESDAAAARWRFPLRVLGFAILVLCIKAWFLPASVSVANLPIVQATTTLDPMPVSSPVTLYRGELSRDDEIAPKNALTVDGIVVELEDADSNPLDVDVEVRVDGIKREYEDLRLGDAIHLTGRSGRQYRFAVDHIDDEHETLRFTLRD